MRHLIFSKVEVIDSGYIQSRNVEHWSVWQVICVHGQDKSGDGVNSILPHKLVNYHVFNV